MWRLILTNNLKDLKCQLEDEDDQETHWLTELKYIIIIIRKRKAIRWLY